MQDNIKFSEYQSFVDSMKKYPEEHKIIYPALGLAGECGEYIEKVKKNLRGDGPLDKVQAAKELGDCLFYLSASASDIGFSLEEIASLNIEKLISRQERGVIQGNGDNR